MRLTLALACCMPAASSADEAPPWMRTVSVTAVQPPPGGSPTVWTAVALDSSAALQACSELLAAAPSASEEVQVPLVLGLWEDGRVREVSGPQEELQGARQCVLDVADALRFPADAGRSDERSVGLTIRLRWARARLEFLALTEEQKRILREVPDPTIEGNVDINAILAGLGGVEAAMARCVSRRRRKVPDMGSRMDVLVRLSRDPDTWAVHVDAMVVIDSDLGDEQAEVCVMKQLGKVAWPPPYGSGRAQIIWPFVFAH